MKIDDIARIAKVSKASVSLALNNRKGISEETRTKIINIANQYGYKPRNYVKGLKENKIYRFVACTSSGIIDDKYESQSFFMELINNIDKSVSSQGYSLIISSVTEDKLYDQLHNLEKEQQSDGIILLGTNLTKEQINIVQNIHQNVVVLDTCFDTVSSSFIVMNNEMGGYEAANHLLELGHRKIGYLKSKTRMYNFNEREKGFYKAIEENGLNRNDIKVYTLSPTDVVAQEVLAEQIKNEKDLPTGVFAECDYMAISAMKTFGQLNIKVPEDISIIGFDNIPETLIASPELTTIDVNQNKIAQLAIQCLLTDQDEGITTKIKVDTKLIIRKSSQIYREA